MEPFDLEKWKTGEYEVVTRDGTVVKGLCNFNEYGDRSQLPLVGVIDGLKRSWFLNGMVYENKSFHPFHPKDLMLRKPSRIFYGLYGGNAYVSCYTYEVSEQQAKTLAYNYKQLVKFTEQKQTDGTWKLLSVEIVDV